MTRGEFEQLVLEKIQDGWRTNEEVTIEKIQKNNAEEMAALKIVKEGCVPLLYLEDYYELLEEGREIEEVLQMMREHYDAACANVPFYVPLESGFDEIRQGIIYRLVNYERNREMLKDCPYFRLHDLAVTFRWMVFHHGEQMATTTITNELMERWNVDKNELIFYAIQNSQTYFAPFLTRLDEFLDELGMLDHVEGGHRIDMYILSNQMRSYGAGVIFYDDYLKSLACQMGCDLFILPSSIHEVIIVPVNPEEEEKSTRMLQKIVREANQTVVESQDYLSDSVYIYRRNENRLEWTSH